MEIQKEREGYQNKEKGKYGIKKNREGYKGMI